MLEKDIAAWLHALCYYFPSNFVESEIKIIPSSNISEQASIIYFFFKIMQNRKQIRINSL